MREFNEENNEEEIVIDIGNNNQSSNHGRRNTRIGNNKKAKKDNKNKDGKKKRFTKKQKILIALGVIGAIIILLGIVFGVYVFKAGGNVKDAVLNMATDIVGDQDPIFVLVLGVSEDISAKLTDTIMLCGYNPSTQKAFMFSIPRDTFVGNSEASAGGYDKINAQFQKSADKTVEKVQLITGVTIDYYVIVRNISLTSIFEEIGSIEFDVPINMDYDDPTQDLHIHLKKGLQTLEPNQIEQLLRFRHNNDGSSYPSSYGDNDYGRMRTQRDFIKAVIDQKVSLANIGALKGVASSVYTNLQTNMSGYTVLDYVPHALKFNTSALRTEQLPGQSAMINNLWFYRTNFNKTRNLVNELMVYLELDNETLKSHYKYWKDIEGVKPDGNWVANEVYYKDDYVAPSKKDENEVVDKEKCNHEYVVYDDSDKSSCTKTGTIVYKCINCMHEYSKQTEALGHSFKNGVCTREGCNEKDPKYKAPTQNENKVNNDTIVDDDKNNNNDKEPEKHTKHEYTIEVSKTPATCTENGKVVKKCSGCDLTTEEVITAKGHSFSDDKPTCSVCGTSNPSYKPSENPDSGENKDDSDKKDENTSVNDGSSALTPVTGVEGAQ